MKMHSFVVLLAMSSGVLGAAVWPTLSFNPPLANPVTMVSYVDGMQAWGDLPNSRYIDIPQFLIDSNDHRAYILSEPIPANTEITFTCHNDDLPETSKCDLYVYTDFCPPCNLHGGLPGILISRGWMAGSCAPNYKLSNAGPVHDMSMLRRQIDEGTSISFTTSTVARFVGFGATPFGEVCSESSNLIDCGAKRFCLYSYELGCTEDWCPRRTINQPPPQFCDICADSEL